MALNWNTVQAEHVAKACELVGGDEKARKLKAKGIFIVSGDSVLPAKQVIRAAYLLANDLPLDTKLKFSSGESTVKRLQSLGFQVERRGQTTPKGAPDAPSETSESL